MYCYDRKKGIKCRYCQLEVHRREDHLTPLFNPHTLKVVCLKGKPDIFEKYGETCLNLCQDSCPVRLELHEKYRKFKNDYYLVEKEEQSIIESLDYDKLFTV